MRHAVAAALALLALGASALAEEVTEPATGVAFPAARSFGGRPMSLVGTGVRRKFVVKVYGMGLYVDDDARRAYHGEPPQPWVMGGSFGKAGVLHFVRAVDAGKIKGAFEESLEAELAAADTKDAARAFLRLFDRDLSSGAELVIETAPDGQIAVATASERRLGPKSVKLAKAIWGIWLGAQPISSDMRTSLVERLK